MEFEAEELRAMGAVAICRSSVQILVGPHRLLFARIAAAFVLPLSALFLLHVAFFLLLLRHLFSDAVDASIPVDSDSHRRRLWRFASDYGAILAFKAAYLVALLLLSLLSTAAAVFAVASVYSGKHDAAAARALGFRQVLSVVPRIWRRLASTFVAAFALMFADNSLSFTVMGLFFIVVDDGLLGSLAGGAAYLAGLVYLSVVWHLASVVSVLEDREGLAAMRRSRDLIRGKFLAASAIFATLGLVFATVEVGFGSWVVRSSCASSAWPSRLLLGLAMLAALCCVVMVALVAQTLLYLVCKSYHGESIDRAGISDHLEAYVNGYVPLRASDIQMEQLQL